MANHKSAIKRHRQSLKRRDRNRNAKSAIRTSIKEVQAKIAAGDSKGAAELLKHAESLLAKAAAKGILHAKNASRRIGRLAASVTAKGGTSAVVAKPSSSKPSSKKSVKA